MLLAGEAQSLNPWTTKEVPKYNFLTCSVLSTDLHLLVLFFLVFFAESLDGCFCLIFIPFSSIMYPPAVKVSFIYA